MIGRCDTIPRLPITLAYITCFENSEEYCRFGFKRSISNAEDLGHIFVIQDYQNREPVVTVMLKESLNKYA